MTSNIHKLFVNTASLLTTSESFAVKVCMPVKLVAHFVINQTTSVRSDRVVQGSDTSAA